MNHVIEKHEQYALIHIKESTLDDKTAPVLEEVARGLLREEFRNIIINLSDSTSIDVTTISTLKKLNVLCARELGLMVLVSDNDEFVDKLLDAKIRDVTILPTVEEAIDAVFMNDLENEFGADSSDFDDDDFGEDGFSNSEQP